MQLARALVLAGTLAVPVLSSAQPAPAVAPSADELAPGAPSRGFFLRLGIGGSVPAVVAYPSLMAGYRLIDRLEVHLALQLAVSGTNNNAGNSTTDLTFAFVPGLTVDILRFSGNRVVFYGDAGLPLGVAAATAGGASATAFVIGFNLGLGVRYFPIRNFAIGFEGGLIGLFGVGANSNLSAGSGTYFGFYGALNATLYFGRFPR